MRIDIGPGPRLRQRSAFSSSRAKRLQAKTSTSGQLSSGTASGHRVLWTKTELVIRNSRNNHSLQKKLGSPNLTAMP